MRFIWIGLFAGLLVSVACDDDNSNPQQDGGTGWDGEVPNLAGACSRAVEVGQFIVEHSEQYSSVSGRVRDGVVPGEIPNLKSEEGGCKLWHHVNPVCDPSCPPGETCDYDGTCIPYPLNKSVGNVIIDGLEKDVTIEPPAYFDTEMPHPPFAPGNGIRLTAEGEDYEGFTLYGGGVTPMQVPDEKWVIVEHEDLQVSWVAATDPQAYVEIMINIDQHGVSPMNMICIFDDTGSASIPADLIDEFMENGVTGYSTVYIMRKTADSVQLDHGCVDFEVYSRMKAELEVEGHIPCSGPQDCPDGMTCDMTIQTCV